MSSFFRCYYVFALLVLICLIVSLVLSIAGILTHRWWVGHFEAEVPLINTTNGDSQHYLHIDFALNYGLVDVCWSIDMVQAPSFYNQTQPHIHRCIDDLADTFRLKNIKKDMEPLMYTFVCLIITIVFNALACIFSFIKMPCITMSRKPGLRVSATISTFLAAIACMIALIIANENLRYENTFIKSIMAAPTIIGKHLTKSTLQLIYKIFSRARDKDLSRNFRKGLSFDFVCVAELFLLLALIFGLIEICCAKRSYKDRSSQKLIIQDKDGVYVSEQHS